MVRTEWRNAPIPAGTAALLLAAFLLAGVWYASSRDSPPPRGPFRENFDRPAEQWVEGSRRGRFTTVFHGFGRVGVEGGALVLSPKAASKPEITHGALVVGTLAHDDRTDFSVTMTTTGQLRTGSPPNVWEAGWVVWNYVDPTNFWYLVLKPNGWEVGRVDPVTKGQVFLATGDEPRTPIGTPRRTRVRHSSPVLSVWVDGELIVDRSDMAAKHTPLFGFYTEDATVAFDDVSSPAVRD